MKNILSTLLVSLWLSHISALCNSVTEAHNSTEKRQAACGDPSLTEKYFEAYSIVHKAHAINTRSAFINADTHDNPWAIDEASFRAWRSPGQPGTFPFYLLRNPSLTDFAYLVSTNGSPPTLSGFGSPGIIGYVYSTQICGSVPLYGASGASDHWYTTDLSEHNVLINEFGWTDVGVAAYVLPLNDNSMSL